MDDAGTLLDRREPPPGGARLLHPGGNRARPRATWAHGAASGNVHAQRGRAARPWPSYRRAIELKPEVPGASYMSLAATFPQDSRRPGRPRWRPTALRSRKAEFRRSVLEHGEPEGVPVRRGRDRRDGAADRTRPTWTKAPMSTSALRWARPMRTRATTTAPGTTTTPAISASAARCPMIRSPWNWFTRR